MSKIIKNNKINNNSNLIGILFLIPIYIFIVIISIFFHINLISYEILPIIMYLPIFIGLILCKKNNRIINIIMSILIIIFICFSVYYYYDTYYVEHPGWDGFKPFALWIINTFICRILSFIYYVKIYSLKKGLFFIGIYFLLILISYVSGIWA